MSRITSLHEHTAQPVQLLVLYPRSLERSIRRKQTKPAMIRRFRTCKKLPRAMTAWIGMQPALFDAYMALEVVYAVKGNGKASFQAAWTRHRTRSRFQDFLNAGSCRTHAERGGEALRRGSPIDARNR